MDASSLIGRPVIHTADRGISGKVADIAFSNTLTEVAFFLIDISAMQVEAPILFSPTVLVLDNDALRTAAAPDDIIARVRASLAQTTIAIDPADLPNTLIGPFGNTISPSMLAALFNARRGVQRPDIPEDMGGGFWLTEFLGHPVRAHVGDIGTVSDMILSDDLSTCEAVCIKTMQGATKRLRAEEVTVTRHAADQLSLSLV